LGKFASTVSKANLSRELSATANVATELTVRENTILDN
jgi:hypothetical protein